MKTAIFKKTKIRTSFLKVLSLVVLCIGVAPLVDALWVDTSAGKWFSVQTGETSSSSSFWHIAKVGLDKAWEIHTGHSSVKVGMIDTGITISHPDLAYRVDTSLSASFSPNSTSPFDPVIQHGTWTAGIFGAKPNNGNGVGGDWNSKIVCLRADGGSNNNYNESYDTILPAIQYATQHSIPIVNYSGGLTNLNQSQISAITNAVAQYPGLFICAAGNSYVNLDNLPSADKIYPQCSTSLTNMIVVGGSTQSDLVSYDSNYGANTVDLFAPGENITSSYGTNSTFSFSGTSASAPLVAAAASLILSVNSTLTPAQIKSIILSNVDVIPELYGKCATSGRLNVYKALMAAIPEYADSGNGMPCVNGQRIGVNEWVKISGASGYKDIHSIGGCPADGALYDTDIDSGPIKTSGPSGSYPYDYHIYNFLSPSNTYYLKSVTNLPISSNSGVKIDAHSHTFDEYEWVDWSFHCLKCSECGSLGTSQHHVPLLSYPETCALCGGPMSGTIHELGAEEDTQTDSAQGEQME